MTERPLPFNAEMVRAIRDGRKTQTRRPMKAQPPARYDHIWPETPIQWLWSRSTSGEGAEQQDLWTIPKSPFGVPGDLLWVRETWGIACSTGRENLLLNLPLFEYAGRDDVDDQMYLDPGYHLVYRATHHEPIVLGKWRPNIHMPRWVCRTRLLVKRVWVEPLNSISIDDIEREGIRDGEDGFDSGVMQFWERFRDVWDSIYGDKYPWESNPWVWACEFEVQDNE